MNYPLTHPWFEAHFFNEANVNGGYRDHNPFEGDTAISFAQSQGLLLWCPCGIDEKQADGSSRFPLDLSLNKGRPHLCMVVFRNPPSGIVTPENFGPVSKNDKTRHPRWQVSGNSLLDLTLDPSIDGGTPSCWHGFIKGGQVT
jgi:uncharacterized protein DUF6527